MTRLEKFYYNYLRNPRLFPGDILWYCDYKNLPGVKPLLKLAIDYVTAEDKEYQAWKKEQNFSDGGNQELAEMIHYANWAKFDDSLEFSRQILHYFISKDEGYKIFRKKKIFERLSLVVFYIISFGVAYYIVKILR